MKSQVRVYSARGNAITYQALICEHTFVVLNKIAT